MGNRKQNLKKYLGRSEYPWSSCSDDDEEQQPNQNVLQSTDRESHPSTTDMPGTSGSQAQMEQASPATARKLQDKLDRDLFWSIISNTPRSTNVPTPRSRMAVPLASTQRSSTNDSQPHSSRSREDDRNPEERTDSRRTGSLRTDNARSDNARMDRQPISEELQRIMAFKRLTRNLHHFTQHRGCTNRPSSLPQTSSRASRPQERPGPSSEAASRSVPGPSSGATTTGSQSAAIPVTAPAANPAHRRLILPCVGVSPTEMLSPNNILRYGYNSELSWRRALPTYPRPVSNQVQSARRPSWLCSPPPIPPNNSSILDTPSTSSAPFVHVLDPPGVEDETLPKFQTAVQKTKQRDETTENAEEENGEDTSPNETGSGARLIEEVVEVDAPDEADNNPPPPGTEEEEVAETSAENNTINPETPTPEDNAEAAQQASTYQGMKRKRDTTDEANELFSVHEFNQSLLRLLECPVCLEWMEPPISQCRRGHLVCSRCRARLSACPVCRTPFSSVRNRAMEGVAEMLRYPCRHGCGREVRLRRRAPHEASCAARRYACPAPACARHPPLPRDELTHHFQCKHLPILKIGCKHKFSMKVNSEQHDTWLIMALGEYFHLRVDVDLRAWGVVVFVAYIGPKRNVKSYLYEVTVKGQHNTGKLVFSRTTHSDLESSSINLNLRRQNCFHLIPEHTVNYLRFKNRHCEPEKILDFEIEISKWDNADEVREDSDS